MVEWEGAERPAAVFRSSRGQSVLGPIAILLIGALGVYGLASTHDAFDLVLSLLLVLLAVVGVLGIIASFRGQTYIALLRDGILIKSIAGWTFVPWESILLADQPWIADEGTATGGRSIAIDAGVQSTLPRAHRRLGRRPSSLADRP